MTTTTIAKLTASDRRAAFLESLLEDYNGQIRQAIAEGSEDTVLMGVHYWIGRAELMADEGAKLGRTDRWKDAAGFALAEITAKGDELTEDFGRWAVVQGVIFAGYAA